MAQELHGNEAQCPIHNLLSPELREQADLAPHLMAYLHNAPFAEHRVPDYYAAATRKLGDIKDPNLIYVAGNGTYVHVYPDAADARNFYVAIEPGNDRLADLIEHVELRLLAVVEQLADAETREAKNEVLLEAIEHSCEVTGPRTRVAEAVAAGEAGFLKLSFLGGGGSGGAGSLRVSEDELESLKYRVIRDKIGM